MRQLDELADVLLFSKTHVFEDSFVRYFGSKVCGLPRVSLFDELLPTGLFSGFLLLLSSNNLVKGFGS